MSTAKRNICGYSGYAREEWLLTSRHGSQLTQGQKDENKTRSQSPVAVERMFKEVKEYSSAMDFKRKLRIGQALIGKLYICSVLLANMRNCVYPFQRAQYIKCTPFSLGC